MFETWETQKSIKLIKICQVTSGGDKWFKSMMLHYNEITPPFWVVKSPLLLVKPNLLTSPDFMQFV